MGSPARRVMNVMKLPEHWKIARLGELGDLVRGVTYKRQETSETSNPEYLPILRATNIQDRQLLLEEELVYVKGEKVSDLQLLGKGDVIIAMSSGSKSIVGKAAQFNSEWEGSFGAFCAVFRHNSTIEPFFIGQIFQTNRYRKHLFKEARGTNINNLSKGHILDYQFPLPPLPEQRAIAHILHTIQEAKFTRQREITLERERKAALMDFLFSHGTKGEPRKQTEIGEIPESWEVVRFEDVCTFTTGKLNSEKAVEDGQYPFFTCSQETFKIDSYSFDQEAILLSGNNAKGIFSVKYYKGKFDAYQRTYIITINDAKQLFYQYFLYELFLKLELLRRQSIGATTKYLTASIIRNLELTLPPLSEQHTISSVLWSCDTKIAALEREVELIDELFHAMLEELMTGQRSAVPLIDTEMDR